VPKNTLGRASVEIYERHKNKHSPNPVWALNIYFFVAYNPDDSKDSRSCGHTAAPLKPIVLTRAFMLILCTEGQRVRLCWIHSKLKGPTTRSSTTLSSKVIFQDAINFRALSSANLVICHPPEIFPKKFA